MNYIQESTPGKYNFGWDKFYGGSLNPELPKHSEDYGSSPVLPRDLLGENEHLSTEWEQQLWAQKHEGITGALSRQILTKASSFSYSKITLHSGDARPAIYGEVSEIPTRSIQFFQGTLQGVVPMGVQLPRGLWEEGVEDFKLLWDTQVSNVWDTLERHEQCMIYYRMLNNVDGNMYSLRKNKEPLAQYSVEDYLNEFVNPIINCYKRLNGWNKFINFDKKYMNAVYPQRLKDGKSQSWIFLVSPDADEFAKFYKQENLLFLFNGNQNEKYPRISLWDYSNDNEVFGDALHIIENFHRKKNMTLGINILTRNKEYARYFRFKPWNMISQKKVGLDSYDIIIIDDVDQNPECRLKYVDCVKALPLDEIHEFFGITPTQVGNEKRVSFHQLVQKTIIANPKVEEIVNLMGNKLVNVVGTISQGKVKTPLDYYDFMLNVMDVDETVNALKMGISNGDIIYPTEDAKTKKLMKEKNVIDYHPLFLKWINKISPLVKFLVEFVDKDEIGGAGITKPKFQNDLLLLFTIFKIPNIVKEYKKSIEYVDFDINEHSVILGKMSRDDFLFNLTVDNFEKKEVIDTLKIEIFKNLIIYNDDKNNKVSFQKIAQAMIDIGICMPFGIFVFKRSIFRDHTTTKARKKCIDQYSQKMLVNVVQDPHNSDINISVWKSYGEDLKEIRDVKNYRGTLIEKCTIGGGNKLWKKPTRNKKITGLNTFSYGDIFVVPVKLNEVLGKRIHMINRTGWDYEPKWTGVVKKLRLQKEVPNKYYYSTWDKCVKHYKWGSLNNRVHTMGDFYFNHKLAKFDPNHWAGWQKYLYDNTEEPETGPFKNHPWWWRGEEPIINTRNVKHYNNPC